MNGLEIHQATFSYGQLRCLDTIDLRLDSGFFYGLIGPNGSGKSTLLDLISGYLQPENGSITLNDKPVSNYRRSSLARLLTLVPQSFAFNFDFNVYETVLMGRHPHIDRFSNPTEEDHNKVRAALETLEVDRLADRSIRHLSGGEKQRVTVARALAQDTEYILLDEVTANLDVNHAISIMKTLKNLTAQGRTVIAALHDLNMALAFCDRVIVLNDGKLHAYGNAAEIVNSGMVADIYQVSSDILKTTNGTHQLLYRYDH